MNLFFRKTGALGSSVAGMTQYQVHGFLSIHHSSSSISFFVVVPRQSDNRSGYSNPTHSVGHRRVTCCHRNWGISQRWLWYSGTRVIPLSYDIDSCTHFNISLRESGAVSVLSEGAQSFGPDAT